MFQTIAFDADDTLWHNEMIFQDTQKLLYQMLKPYADEEVIHQKLSKIEMSNVRVFGYGITGFSLSMIETALLVSSGQIPQSKIQYIIDCGKQMLEAPLELLPDVKQTLEKLINSYSLMLISKGDLMHQMNKIERSGLAELFSLIEIVHEKNNHIYKKIFHKHGITPSSLLMVGNSMRSDILPILEIGGSAVYIPYHVTSHVEMTTQSDIPADRFWQLESLKELPQLLSTLHQ
ncbi:HAD superfamily hydrolase [Tolypothrix sp. NIES-4075]|uniref:HAD family hydrolase n=1 Tax=Tolypothrix sp. NIES-4075 TaxID=2005459 RepID=UPI000B5CB91E|nr:HAD family hydrolase [Tolypothrix sp. NIES-4075]GAX43178.1 HAD superfamily hydrolase [Tolypothrix sp. NIES-4075]